jgi:hypothetical protein
MLNFIKKWNIIINLDVDKINMNRFNKYIYLMINLNFFILVSCIQLQDRANPCRMS